MADEAKKATSQVDEAERRLRDKTKEVSALQTQLSEMTDRVQVSPLYNRIDLNLWSRDVGWEFPEGQRNVFKMK